MNIGKAAELTGLKPKTIRYYEDIALLVPDRKPNGYRDYSDAHINILNFLKVSRSLGFSIENCRALLGMYQDEARESKNVKQMVAEQIIKLDRIIVDSQQMKTTLQHLSDNCHGDNRPQCAILDAFSAGIVNKSDQLVNK